eukprot:scaffold8910_cov102-Cylindrotheca_fusiformis.AAC.4
MTAGEATPYVPNSTQQKYLSFLSLPPGLISIVGSISIIIHIRQEKRNTPYRSILYWLSWCDVVNSTSLIFQPFLTPAEGAEAWVWSVGNDATCTLLGALTQFGFSTHWYSGLLSFYFLLTVRFGVKEKSFGKALPYCHGIIVLWSITTAITGIIMEVYGPLGTGPGCWVAADDECEENCIEVVLGWIFGGMHSMLMMVSIIVNNLLLYCHVRRTIAEGQRRALEAETRLATYGSQQLEPEQKRSKSGPGNAWRAELGMSKSGSWGGNLRGDVSSTSGKTKSVLRSSDKQWQLVREVGKQSFLYVGAFFLCFAWSYAITALDSQDYEYEPGIGKLFLPLLIFQSIFLPAQGVFNAIIFFRPKYLKNRQEFPNESRRWIIRRTVFGKKVLPEYAVSEHSTPLEPAPDRPKMPPTLRINCERQVVAMSTLDRADCSENDGSHIDENVEEDTTHSTRKMEEVDE